MNPVLTPDEARTLLGRIFVVIDTELDSDHPARAARHRRQWDRARANYDGLLQHGENPSGRHCYWCHEMRGPYPCPDAQRYSDDLCRVGLDYGEALS